MNIKSKQHIISSGGFILLVVLSAGSAWAQDRIYLVGETKPLIGKISEANKLEVKFESRKQEKRTFAPNEIAMIKWEGEPTRFASGRNFEQSDNYTKALEAYQEASTAAGSATERIKDDIKYHLLRVEAKMLLAGEPLPEGKKPGTVISALQKFLEDRKTFYAYYPGKLLLGRLYQHQGDPAALEIFAELQKTPWAEYQIWGLTAEGRQKLNQGDAEAALEVFNKAIKLPSTGTLKQTARAEASLGKAECLNKLNQSEEALGLIEKLIDTLPESASDVQSRVYLTQGRLYQELKRNKEATVAFLHVDILFPQETKEHAEALYHLSRLWTALGKPERAAIAANKLEEQYPESEWLTEMSKPN